MPESQIGTADERRAPAVYLPFKTFLSAFDVFDHGIPKRVDRTMWRNQSGVIQGQIMMALRFFSLLNQDDEPTPGLSRFVSGKDKRKEHVGALLQHAYSAIFDHDLTKTTAKMLSQAFDDFGVSGETKRKATAFFLQAARFAELPMHPLLSSSVRTPSSTQRKRRKNISTPKQVEDQAYSVPTSNNQTDSKRFRLKSGAELEIKISANWLDLPSDERKFVFEIIDLLQSPSAPLSKNDLEVV